MNNVNMFLLHDEKNSRLFQLKKSALSDAMNFYFLSTFCLSFQSSDFVCINFHYVLVVRDDSMPNRTFVFTIYVQVCSCNLRV